MITHNRYAVGDWREEPASTWWARIYVGGDVAAAEMACRAAVFPQGLCVTIQPTRYIFAGGAEDGVEVGMIQYPPFPETEAALMAKAQALCRAIAEANHQWSATVVSSTGTVFLSRRTK